MPDRSVHGWALGSGVSPLRPRAWPAGLRGGLVAVGAREKDEEPPDEDFSPEDFSADDFSELDFSDDFSEDEDFSPEDFSDEDFSAAAAAVSR